MDLAYLFALDPRESPGVFKKIKSQISEWSRVGNTVRVFNVRPNTSRLTDDDLGKFQHIWHDYERPLGLSGIMGRINTWESAVNDILEWDPDLVYYRYERFWPSLKYLAQQVPVVTEINTVEREYFLRSKKWYIYHKLTKPFFFTRTAGLVGVSSEICDQYSKVIDESNRRVISNGIPQDEYKILSPSHSPQPELVFIGDGKPWHGIDKIMKLAELRPKWKFNIVGDIDQNKQENYRNVEFHGSMDKKEYEPIFKRSDIGIGTLAFHRNNISEGCPLKVREYLAYGLPVIIGYTDVDFDSTHPFILEIPNQEESIQQSLNEIDRFTYDWQGQRVPPEKVTHIRAEEKEKERLCFFKSLLNEFY